MGISSGLPSNREIIDEAMEALRQTEPEILEGDTIEGEFSRVVMTVFDKAYETYKRHERELREGIPRQVLEREAGETFSREDVVRICGQVVDRMVEAEMSFKQSRSSRAGKSFEIIIRDLLAMIGIPSESVTAQYKRQMSMIDLVVPDIRTALEEPDRAFFLSLKTSLRERWKQVVTEQNAGQRTYLLTLLQRETLSNDNAESITRSGIVLCVPDRAKEDRFPDNPRIRGLSVIPSILRGT
ncbi:MAG: hypothetical protein MPI82_06590 [Nitrosopumilus sp.]|nr:hypothetical protein [Nitrosopumilus sp.]MDA7999505.1 hypothetical protein [Nitrosopumilus sp.]